MSMTTVILIATLVIVVAIVCYLTQDRQKVIEQAEERKQEALDDVRVAEECVKEEMQSEPETDSTYKVGTDPYRNATSQIEEQVTPQVTSDPEVKEKVAKIVSPLNPPFSLVERLKETLKPEVKPEPQPEPLDPAPKVDEFGELDEDALAYIRRKSKKS